MNYSIMLGGYRFQTLDMCIKLFMHSAKESDYIVRVRGKAGLSPASPKLCSISLTGSSKKAYNDITLDFDGVFGNNVKGILLNPEILGLDAEPVASHYWGMLGALCKVISDVSPAYVTGYLLEKNMKKELEMFTKFSSQLPFALQVAINETMKDIAD